MTACICSTQSCGAVHHKATSTVAQLTDDSLHLQYPVPWGCTPYTNINCCTVNRWQPVSAVLSPMGLCTIQQHQLLHSNRWEPASAVLSPTGLRTIQQHQLMHSNWRQPALSSTYFRNKKLSEATQLLWKFCVNGTSRFIAMLMRQREALSSNSLQSDLTIGSRDYQALLHKTNFHCHIHNIQQMDHIQIQMKPPHLK